MVAALGNYGSRRKSWQRRHDQLSELKDLGYCRECCIVGYGKILPLPLPLAVFDINRGFLGPLQKCWADVRSKAYGQLIARSSMDFSEICYTFSTCRQFLSELLYPIVACDIGVNLNNIPKRRANMPTL